MSHPAEKLFDASDLARLLATALGRERADQAVKESLARLGLPSRALTSDQTRATLGFLAQTDGVVGVAGRYALQRLNSGSRELGAQSADGRPQLRSMSVAAVIALFVPSVGSEKAREVVTTALQKLGVNSEVLEPQQVADLLERLASASGIVGTVARFARARLLLQPAAKDR